MKDEPFWEIIELAQWTKDPSCHVRRLVSEGSRTRLPWAMRLRKFQADPAPVIALLDKLYNDPVRYVQRSVANNLNDITKDHPDLAVATLKRWHGIELSKKKNGGKLPDGLEWITRHALRSLIKQGHPGALELMGFRQDLPVKMKDFKLSTDKLKLGQSLGLSFELVWPAASSKRKVAKAAKKTKGPSSKASVEPNSGKLAIDFVVHFMKANGKTSPKVFKLTQKDISAGDTLKIEKKHPIKKISTRQYYPGRHAVEIQVNGKSMGRAEFDLEV